MAKRDFNAALSKTVRTAGQPPAFEDRFSRAEAFLERAAPPIAPNAAVPEPAAPPPPPPKTVIRDSFSFPEDDYGLIGALQERLLGVRRVATKSEVLRAGLKALVALDDDALAAAFDRVERLKAGRKPGS
jgi:hypothetical protein